LTKTSLLSQSIVFDKLASRLLLLLLETTIDWRGNRTNTTVFVIAHAVIAVIESASFLLLPVELLGCVVHHWIFMILTSVTIRRSLPLLLPLLRSISILIIHYHFLLLRLVFKVARSEAIPMLLLLQWLLVWLPVKESLVCLGHALMLLRLLVHQHTHAPNVLVLLLLPTRGAIVVVVGLASFAQLARVSH